MATKYQEYDPEKTGPYGAALGYDSSKKKVYKPSVSHAEGKSGIAQWFGNFQDFLRDFDRNVGNAGSSLDAWLMSKEQPVQGGGAGDARQGRDPNIALQKDLKKVLGGGPNVVPDRVDSYSRFAALTDTYTDPYAGARAALTSQGAANDARLEAMYRQVADYIAGQKGDTEAIYNKAAEDYRAGTNTAVNTVNAGYGTAREQLTNALNALGIQDAAKTILARNEDMSGQQTASTTALANILSSNLNRNTAAQTGALSNLINMSTATMGEGARARSAYQQAIASQLAQLEGQSATARNSYYQALASSQADAEAAAAEAAAGAKASISSDQYMTEYTNAYNKFKEQNYTDEAARSAAESYMKAWYGNKAIS